MTAGDAIPGVRVMPGEAKSGNVNRVVFKRKIVLDKDCGQLSGNIRQLWGLCGLED